MSQATQDAQTIQQLKTTLTEVLDDLKQKLNDKIACKTSQIWKTLSKNSSDPDSLPINDSLWATVKEKLPQDLSVSLIKFLSAYICQSNNFTITENYFMYNLMIAAKQKKFLLHRSLNNDSCKFVKKIYKKISESLSSIPKASSPQPTEVMQGEAEVMQGEEVMQVENPETQPAEFGLALGRPELNFNLTKDLGGNWLNHNFSSNQETRRAKGWGAGSQRPGSGQNFEPENDKDRSSSPFTFTKSKPDNLIEASGTANGFRNFFTAKPKFCAPDQKNDRYKENFDESVLENKNPDLLPWGPPAGPMVEAKIFLPSGIGGKPACGRKNSVGGQEGFRIFGDLGSQRLMGGQKYLDSSFTGGENNENNENGENGDNNENEYQTNCISRGGKSGCVNDEALTVRTKKQSGSKKRHKRSGSILLSVFLFWF